jgi:DNA-binding transcriptional LysR family regulator
MSPATWRLADLFAKHHFLLNGLGWGGMPLHAVRKDLEDGRLSVLPIEDVPPDGLILPMLVLSSLITSSAGWYGSAPFVRGLVIEICPLVCDR